MTTRDHAHTSSTRPVSTTLRPRTRRLISGLDDEEELSNTLDDTRLSSRIATFSSTSPNRPISPIPAPYLPRPESRSDIHNHEFNTIGNNGISSYKKTETSMVPFSSLWGTSWSTLQVMASDLLGAGTADRERSARTSAHIKPVQGIAGHSRSAFARGSWGPAVTRSPPGKVGVGTEDEQGTSFRAQKRIDMLTNQDTAHLDTFGRFKRRSSNDKDDVTATSERGSNPDALVYVHAVGKDDTLAGISIRYHCSVADLRKVNRMWPNDTVQMREQILLPVDMCGVKGRIISSPNDISSISSEAAALQAGQAVEVRSILDPVGGFDGLQAISNTRDSPGQSSLLANGLLVEGDSAWQHDSWVMLPNASVPTRIMRVPRTAIGYFPAARVKSKTYADSRSSRTSLDSSHTHRTLGTDAVAISPYRTESLRRGATRDRSTSNVERGYFPPYLSGPGGVGSMGKEVSLPGPGPDSLNKIFAKHLPDVAPPRFHQTLLTPCVPLWVDDASSAARLESESASTRKGKRENVGDTIESWVRRVASRTQDALGSNSRASKNTILNTPSLGTDGGDTGDLIEMTSDFDNATDGSLGDRSSRHTPDDDSALVSNVETHSVRDASFRARNIMKVRR